MKIMKNIFGIASLVFILGMTSAFVQVEKVNTITFITSAVCDECKERIEEKLNYTKGIIFAELDVATKMLTVKYKTEIITDQKIKEILAGIGYSSDTVVRDREAYLALPKCCQGGSACEPKK